MKKLVIIPAYNEEKNIEKVIEDLQKNAPDFDYVIINDCSQDKTKELCIDKGYNVLNLAVNLGIGGGVQTGYKYALEKGYDIVVQFDGDGQHDAAYISVLFKHMIHNKLDMVIGSRFIEKKGFQSSITRRAGINFLSMLIKTLTCNKIMDVTSGFRMVNKRIIESFCKYYPRDYPEPESIVAIIKQGYSVGEVAVKMRERQEGKSSINLAGSIYYMIKVSIAIIIGSLKEDYRGGRLTWKHNLE